MSVKPPCPNCGVPLKDATKCVCGWRAAPRRTEAFEEDHWPDKCMHQGCLEPTAVVLVMGRHITSNTPKLMPPSHVFIRDSHGNTTFRVKDNMIFDGWVTRCSDHFLQEQLGRKQATQMRVHMENGYRKFLEEHPEFKVKPRNDDELREIQEVCMAKIRKVMSMVTKLPYQPKRRYSSGKKNLTAEQEAELLAAIKPIDPDDIPPLTGEDNA